MEVFRSLNLTNASMRAILARSTVVNVPVGYGKSSSLTPFTFFSSAYLTSRLSRESHLLQLTQNGTKK